VFAFSALIVASVSVNAEDEPTYENPELQFKFNLKETQNSQGSDDLSPQNKLPSDPEATKTVTADVEYDILGFKVGRNPVDVGTWTSEPVGFDVSISIASFDIWWEDLEDTDDTCEWTISILHNDQEVSEDTSDCQHNGAELDKGSHNLATNIDLIAGDTISIDLVFEGWDDIKIHYDNVTFDTGLSINSNSLFFFGGMWKGTEVNIEFAEAWPTNWETNLDGRFVMLMGDEGYMADNNMAEVTEGSEYSITMTNGTVDVTSTIITWTEVTGTGMSLMMDYTTFDHMPSTGNGSGNGTNGTGNQALVTVNLMKATHLLGDGDGLLGLPGFEIILAVPALAFVARRFRN
jgi:hypothetical protein